MTEESLKTTLHQSMHKKWYYLNFKTGQIRKQNRKSPMTKNRSSEPRGQKTFKFFQIKSPIGEEHQNEFYLLVLFCHHSAAFFSPLQVVTRKRKKIKKTELPKIAIGVLRFLYSVLKKEFIFELVFCLTNLSLANFFP